MAPGGGGGGSSRPSIGTELSSWYGGIPPTCRFVLSLCTGIYLVALLTGWDDASALCLSPALFAGQLQLWRAFTAIFVHLGFLHLLFNMLALVSLKQIEHHLGSAKLMYLILLFAFLAACVSVVVAYVLQATGLAALRWASRECAAGFSGILFALIVMEQNLLGGGEPRSIFGLFAVPAAYYPWALLALYQFLMPGVSFVGHLAGILVGQMYNAGWLSPLMPPASALNIVADLPGRWLGRQYALNLIPGGGGGDYAHAAGGGGGAGSGNGAWGTAAAAGAGSWVGQQVGAVRSWMGGGGGSGADAGSSAALPRAHGPPGGAPAARGHTLGGGTGVSRLLGQQQQPQPPPLPPPPPKALSPTPTGGASTGGEASSSSSFSTQLQRPPAGAPSGGHFPYPDALAALSEMGFEPGAARSALAAAGGDVNLAVERLSGGNG